MKKKGLRTRRNKSSRRKRRRKIDIEYRKRRVEEEVEEKYPEIIYTRTQLISSLLNIKRKVLI